MKNYLLLMALVMTSVIANAQVGIGTLTPNSNLDIPATNPAAPTNTDGILIPRIDAFPATNPTAVQNGMMVFLTTLFSGNQPGFYYWDDPSTSWKGIGGNTANAWNLVGNASTNPATNFIGTTDNVPLILKVNGQKAGRIGITDDLFLGYQAGNVNTGVGNTALGVTALSTNVNAIGNTAVGFEALKLSNSNFNTAVGYNAAKASNGLNNTAVGAQTLEANTTGAANTAIGAFTLSVGNHTGNTAVGQAIQSAGDYNTAVGNNAGGGGNRSVNIGNDAGHFNGSNDNVVVGASAMNFDSRSAQNTIVGAKAYYTQAFSNANTSWNANNVAVGHESMYLTQSTVPTNGINNTAVGAESLRANAAGKNNTALGYQAGNLNTLGWNNIMIGSGANAPSATANDQMSIGNVIYGTTMSTTALGKIGIGETAPAAKLQISSATPATPVNTDGIIIPRVSTLTAAGSMTVAQKGMMVFLTTLFSGNQPGFYYWDDVGNAWKGVGTNTANAWSLTGNTGYNAGTTFIGSVDSKEVFFRHTNQPSGVIGVESTAFGYRSGGTYNIVAKNTSIGSLAAESNVAGLDNSAFGAESLNKNTSANKNVAIGNRALTNQSLVNGGTAFDTGNTAVGYSALANVNGTTTTQGIQNVGIGLYALTNNTTGNSNVAVGYSALGANWTASVNPMTGNQNVALGSAAIKSNVTGSGNIGLGGSSLGYNTVGDYNVSIGLDALYFSGGASNGTAIGTRAMQNYNFTYTPRTNDNVALGYEALRGASCCNTYDQNTAIGYQSMASNTLASYNAALGYRSLYNNRNAGKNIAIGSSTLYSQNFTNGGVAFDSNNVAVGSESLYNTNSTSVTNGINNVGIGSKSLYGNSTGSYNLAIGFEAMLGSATPANNVGNSNVAMGSSALSANTAGSNTVAIGRNALSKQSFANGGTAYNSNNVAIGSYALNSTNATSAGNAIGNVGIGAYALSNNATGSGNFALGVFALGLTGSGVGTMTGDDNVAIGTASIKSNTIGTGNVAIGLATLGYNTIGNDNIAIGSDALYNSTNFTGGTAIGARAMENFALYSPTATNDNVAIGYEAMRGTLTTSIHHQNTATGYQSLTVINGGNHNAANGYRTLMANVGGSFNTAFGSLALTANSSGTNNVALGYNAMAGNTTGINNIAIGSGAFGPLANGSNQLSIGNVIYGSNMNNLTGTPAYFSIGAPPAIKYRLYNYSDQVTANGQGQYGSYTYRRRNSRNDGLSYEFDETNGGVAGYNYYGDVYTFGVIGYTDFDWNRCGGVLGSHSAGATWASLGYKNSANIGYGVYSTTAIATGLGRMSQPASQSSVGGGFYGGLIGSWSKGIIGNMSSGSLFASYNSGDEYTTGRQIELVDTGSAKTAAYTVTSTDVIVYKKGKITLVNGMAHVAFDADYVSLLGDVPVVTTTPMGQCNGIYIESVNKSGFIIRELNNGSSNVAVSWIAVGDRIDGRSNTPQDLLDKDFEANLNDVMFNENDKVRSGKAMWSEGNNLKFGTLPASLNPQEKKIEMK